jgi:flagellar motor switch protein FliN/FliY
MQDLKWLLDAWTRELGQSLEMMTARSFRVDHTPAPEPTGSTAHWWRQSFSLAPWAFFWVGVGEADRTAIGALALEAAGVENAEPAEAAGTYQEILLQSLSGAASAASAKLGKTVECASGEAADAPARGCPTVEVTLRSDAFSARLFVCVPADLAAAFSTQPLAPEPEPQSRAAVPRNLDFLLDVEVPVSLSFGQTRLPLRDVLKLTAGSVVELNRQPDEPVDIIINNTVVAQGEVVVVEGNYGVRIHKVLGRQQRLALRGGAGGIA